MFFSYRSIEMKRLFILITYILTVSISQTQALNIYSGTLTVQENDSYGSTLVYNSAAVDMTGGDILSLDMLNSSTADISGGSITQGLYAWNNSTVNMTDGTIGWNLDASDSSTVNLYGGEITDWLYATDDTVVNIYGYGFSYDPDAGGWNGGQLTGFWLDDTPFTIDMLDNIAVDSTYYDHVNLVPEPGSLIMICGGCLFLRKRK